MKRVLTKRPLVLSRSVSLFSKYQNAGSTTRFFSYYRPRVSFNASSLYAKPLSLSLYYSRPLPHFTRCYSQLPEGTENKNPPPAVEIPTPPPESHNLPEDNPSPPAVDLNPPAEDLNTSPAESSKLPVEVPKPKEGKIRKALRYLWHGTVKILVHYWEGTKSYGRNVRDSFIVLGKMFALQSITRRERLLVMQTISDTAKFSIFIPLVVIPFAEFSIPFLLQLFPNMLPSTFTEEQRRDRRTKKINMLKKYSDSIVEVLVPPPEYEKEAHIVAKLKEGEEVSQKELITIAEMFREDFNPDFIDRPLVDFLCGYLNISLGFRFNQKEQISKALYRLKRDDSRIRKDVPEFIFEELREHCINRGILSHLKQEDVMRQQLEEWIHESLDEGTPMHILVLSRVIANASPALLAKLFDSKQSKKSLEFDQWLDTALQIPQKPTVEETNALNSEEGEEEEAKKQIESLRL